MIDDREAQAAILARAKADPLHDLPLAAQCAVSRAQRISKRAGERLAAAYRALPKNQQHIQADEALRLAKQREQTWLDNFLYWQMINNDAIGDIFDQF